MTDHATSRERLWTLLEELPDEALADAVAFLESLRANHGVRLAGTTRFRPTPMGGLTKGVRITAEDIAEARRETWGRFADEEP